MTPCVLALCPAQRCDPSIAIAAVRAGEYGVLDVSWASQDVQDHALAQLVHQSRGQKRWGIRCDARCNLRVLQDRVESVRSHGRDIPTIPLLVVAGGPAGDAFQQFAVKSLGLARNHADKVIAEVYSPAQALISQEMGFDGVVLKGHEAGGRVSRKSAFLLIQSLQDRLLIPFWVQGGIGPQTAAAAMLSGAAGIVLREQLWLAKESPLDDSERKYFLQLDGSETVCIGDEKGQFRFFSRTARETLQDLERQFIVGEAWPTAMFERLNSTLVEGTTPASDVPIPLGQEIAFARNLAEKYQTVGGILGAYRREIAKCLTLAPEQQALRPDGPLAKVHGVKFPILQGPMTRVSDVPDFCQQVADGGGLPFLALALLRGSAVQNLMSTVSKRLGDQSWGVGILGFVSPELRNEQLKAILAHPPKFAIIAGGRPGQAKELEEAGISTYLHVPSRGLLEVFIRDGARKFIFEGRECGGHVGPQCSFSLWQSAISTLLDAKVDDPENFQIVFAGGIHDEISAAMVATMAAPLVERGMKIGVLMGTAYLFTHEAVTSGAITEEFQRQALECGDTALVESGVGHATRCAITPFVSDFSDKKRELLLTGASAEEIRGGLEMFNIGRLRIASKGVARRSSLENGDSKPTSDGKSEPVEEDAKARAVREAAAELAQDPSELITVDTETQRRAGMYMIGEVAALRDKIVSITELHEQASQGGMETLRRIAESESPSASADTLKTSLRAGQRRSRGRDLAIIGMSGMFPDSPDLRIYWQNILNRFDAIREVPADRWDWKEFFSTDRFERDKVYSKWGGFLDDVVIDPLKYQIPPASLFSIEPIQLLALEVAAEALRDGGYDRADFPRERTSVIYAAAGSHDHAMRYAFRTMMRHYLPMAEGLTPEQRTSIYQSMEDQLPEWTEDSFAGFLMNVVAGRISNRFDLGGTNFVVDAACASSLAALQAAAEQLRAGVCDAALVGAVDGTTNALCYMCFAKTHALSPDGHSKSFDDAADGIALGEGLGAMVLKRLADAERDGDNIYAVITGIGSSSDGRNRSLTAPYSAGQLSALERAYADAEVSPASVSLIEAHSTGTTVGDQVECEALSQVIRNANGQPQSCAVGSVKSMIGHAKTAAGIASLIKTTLALNHRTLPPSIGVKSPNPVLKDAASPLYVNSETRPWLVGPDHSPRRAGVSSFGFGGTNFHVVLEEYEGAYHDGFQLDFSPRSCELFAWKRATRQELCSTIDELLSDIDEVPASNIAELASAIFHEEQRRSKQSSEAVHGNSCRLALTASTVADLQEKLRDATRQISEAGTVQVKGVFYSEAEPTSPQEVCFLFPGQGSQSVNMLRDLVVAHPQLHSLFESADAACTGILEKPLSNAIFPPPAFDDVTKQKLQEEVNDTRVAQPALAVVDLFCMELLSRYGIRPAMVAGHSFGEYVALSAAGVITRDDLFRLAALRGQACDYAGREVPGAMAAVNAGEAKTRAGLEAIVSDALIANLNAPDQTVIAGSVETIDSAVDQLNRNGYSARKLKVTAAFHTPALAEGAQILSNHLTDVKVASPSLPVFSNTISAAYPDDPDAIRELLSRHLIEPVKFHNQLQQMYDEGARTFIEVGPGSVLTNLVDRCLYDQPHVALAVAPSGPNGWIGWGNVIARLFALGLPIQISPWFEHRRLPAQGLRPYLESVREKVSRKPTDWIVNTNRAEPVSGIQQPRPKPLIPKTVQQTEPPQSQLLLSTVPQPSPAKQIHKELVVGNGHGGRSDDAHSTVVSSPARTLPQATAPRKPRTASRHDSTPPSPTSFSPKSPPVTTSLQHEGIGHNGSVVGPQCTILSESNQLMSRWLDLQERQLETNERFLDMHERIALTSLATGDGLESIPSHTLPERPLPSRRRSVSPRPISPRSRNGLSANPPVPSESGRAASTGASNRPTITPAPAPRAVTPVSPTIVNPKATTVAPAHVSISGNGSPGGNGHSVNETLEPSVSNSRGADVNAPPHTEDFRQDLLKAVSERTGYPIEMLKEDALLEADLGIDSIKTVEIFSSLTEYHQYMPGGDGAEEESLSEFAKLKTLHDIVNLYDQGRSNFTSPAGESLTDPQGDGENPVSNDGAPLQRYEVTPVAAPVGEAEKKNSPANAPSL